MERTKSQKVETSKPRSRRFDVSAFRRFIGAASLVVLAVTACVGGCAAPQISHLQFGSRRIPGATRSAVFAAARQALVDNGYRLNRVDSESGVITTEPTVAKLDPQTAGGRAMLSSSGRGRRVVEIRLVEGPSGSNIHCRVAIQRLTTEAYHMFRHEAPGTYIPSETAIDLEAASTAEQNAVWKTIRRDKPAERQILDAIVARAGVAPASRR